MSRLYRSTRDKMFTGLIGGLSDYFGVESTLLRFIFVISIFFTGGTTLLIYLIASLVVPKEPYYRDPYGGPGGYDGGYRYNDGSRGDRYRDYRDSYDRDRPRGNRGGYGPRYDRPERDARYDDSYDARGGRAQSDDSDLDAMMKDIEKKALQKEIEELKKKLSNYEKGDK
ncbi:PspC domain-containing protein [Paenibacillus campinasensis]|uniref:Phage shock protein PspC N-terminal domain-containing protein n=1 Tax=Paenibacillus campinasensis TaxID=66347 RepID=A0A268EXN8_9BACL|nr:PspC domain-containing protein [Paenibacillus campinasensis]PAD77898.1 hypothetical protein CHH67_07845 [Paenibacillus campinasensis]